MLKAKKSATILILSEDVITIHAGAVMFAWIAMHPTLALSALSTRLQNAPPTNQHAKSGTKAKWLTSNEQSCGQDTFDLNIYSAEADACNYAKIPHVDINPSPPRINIDYLKLFLQEYPDRNFVDSLLGGLRSGFHTGLLQIPARSFECKNNLSARRNPHTVKACLDSEVSKGYVIGPFKIPPFDCYRTSPLGLAKRKYSDKKGLILDLSAPYDNEEIFSMNEVINKEDYSLSYVKIVSQ